jgi:hypothetical protein
MKTDVIFLGAGASASAGFPLNEGLANYIIYKLPKLKLDPPDDFYHQRWETQPNQWKDLGESLRKTNFLSVDEFCENVQSKPTDVVEMKRMLRLALFSYSDNWWLHRVEYRRFISTLFDAPRHLGSQFAVVNFNYDGLFGKLLADAFLERHRSAGVALPQDHVLATIAGGYYNQPEPERLQEPIVAPEDSGTNEFDHYMPHGTITVAKEEEKLCSLVNIIYGHRDNPTRRKELFLSKYFTTPLVRFPWEKADSAPRVPSHLARPMVAVMEAPRIHFIGLSGHKLLQHSLRTIFSLAASPPDAASTLLGKEYHLATTADPDIVFDKLLDCLLPSTLLRDDKLRDGLHDKLHHYKSFAKWLHKTPHLARV